MNAPLTPLNNEPFHWAEPESDEAFLLLHGLGGGVYEMRMLAEQLHAQNLTVAGINYPGHDKPSAKMPASTWQQWYAHIEQTYQALAAEHDKVSLVGFSTGCPLGLKLAATHPVHRMVLLSPFLRIRQAWFCPLPPETLVRSLGNVIQDIPRLRLPIIDPDMHDRALQAAYFKTFNIAAVHSALELIDHVHPHLERIESPTLIIQSRYDNVVCPSGADILMQRLGSPHKQVVWLEESDHIILLDREREQVVSHILEFIQNPLQTDRL